MLAVTDTPAHQHPQSRAVLPSLQRDRGRGHHGHATADTGPQRPPSARPSAAGPAAVPPSGHPGARAATFALLPRRASRAPPRPAPRSGGRPSPVTRGRSGGPRASGRVTSAGGRAATEQHGGSRDPLGALCSPRPPCARPPPPLGHAAPAHSAAGERAPVPPVPPAGLQLPELPAARPVPASLAGQRLSRYEPSRSSNIQRETPRGSREAGRAPAGQRCRRDRRPADAATTTPGVQRGARGPRSSLEGGDVPVHAGTRGRGGAGYGWAGPQSGAGHGRGGAAARGGAWGFARRWAPEDPPWKRRVAAAGATGWRHAGAAGGGGDADRRRECRRGGRAGSPHRGRLGGWRASATPNLCAVPPGRLLAGEGPGGDVGRVGPGGGTRHQVLGERPVPQNMAGPAAGGVRVPEAQRLSRTRRAARSRRTGARAFLPKHPFWRVHVGFCFPSAAPREPRVPSEILDDSYGCCV